MRTTKSGTAVRMHRTAVPEASWQEWISEARSIREMTSGVINGERLAPGEPRLSHEEIARAAYAHWEARGCPHGSPEEDWCAAERLLRERERRG